LADDGGLVPARLSLFRSVTFGAIVLVAPPTAAREHRIRLRVGFQGCDARNCRAPESVLLEASLTIARP
jgi:hypothetical protein